MSKKIKKTETDKDAAQVNTTIEGTTPENAAETNPVDKTQGTENPEENKPSLFSKSLDEENVKRNVYVDKEEAERFLEQQRKKKKRNRIIATTISVIVVLVAVFVVYKVIFGGNVGYIKWLRDYIVMNDPKPVGAGIDLDAGMTEIAKVKNSQGGETILKFSPADQLLILDITNAKGDRKEIRSWPAPLESEMDPATKDDPYPKYKKNHDIISSLVRLGWTASNLDGGKDWGINQNDKLTIEYYMIENGFKVKYTIPVEITKTNNMAETYKVNYEFSIGVEFYLDENGDLVVNVPKKDVHEDKEEKDYDNDSDEMPRVASIACLPFISAKRQGDSGYYVTPDGSGGLTYFDVPRISTYDEYQKRIYGYDDIFDVFNYPNMTNETISLPAFGTIDDEVMLTCFATESEANASILMGKPGTKSLPFYYISYYFKWREFYQAKLSNGGSEYTFLEVPSGIGDFTMKYMFEIDSSKDYSYVDVAKNIRNFIIEKWGNDKKTLDYLKNSEVDVNTEENKNKNPDVLNLKVFVADINRASVSIFPTYKVMTTFGQIKDIIGDTKTVLPKIRYSVLGWQQNGYYGNITRKYNIGLAMGGSGGLKDLNSYAAESDATVSADVNMLILYGNPKGASLRQAVVKNPGTFYVNYKLVSTAGVFRRDSDYYYMSPRYYNNKMLSNDIKNLSKLGFKNLDLQQLGNLLYTDYNKENALLRQQGLEYYRSWIVKYKEVFDTVSVYYGYEYAASVADNILDIPTETSRLFSIDESVPLLEIVYHGLVDYYSSAVNRSSDYTKTILRSIEYGAFLTYEVTHEPTEELRYTNYNSLFKAQYGELSKDIQKGYVIADKVLAPVAAAEITGHRCVDGARSGNVYCTEYSNGIKVYVNYGDEAFETEDGVVPALGIGLVTNGAFETVNVG
ncbi:MAG: hypothetical protein IJS71_04000 [Clostridia bacterium]|nr:hypothetical protein [Clostridia bacterium]